MSTEKSEQPDSATPPRRLLWLMVPLALAVAAATAILMPSSSMSWPWDSSDPNRSVRVYGDVRCDGFDVGAKTRYPYAKVEGFTIRGQSGVHKDPTGTGYTSRYEVDVPIGWKVEWSVKCSNRSSWKDGSFDVSKTVVGTSYSQRRNVCVGVSTLSDTCVDLKFGNCVELWIGGWLPKVPDVEDAFLYLEQLKNGGPSSIEGCARALADAFPDLNAQPAPDPESLKPTLPSPTHQPLDPVETLPTDGHGEPGSGARGGSDSGAGKPSGGSGGSGGGGGSSEPVKIWVTIHNLVTNGGTQMRDDPTPAYLSTLTVNRCRTSGCMVDDTYMQTGARLEVFCQAQGSRTTNGNDADPVDDGNPGRFESTRWYGGRWSDGRTGFISEVWVSPSDRGGKGLSSC